jgi:type I restriction enzyme S subunit
VGSQAASDQNEFCVVTVNRLYEPDSDYPIELEAIPASWVLTFVGDVTGDVRRGFYTARHNDEGVGIPHLRPMNIGRDGLVVLTNVKYVENSTDLRVRRGEIIFNNTNSAELVGKTAVFDQDGEWTFSNHITRLLIPSPFSAEFVAYQFLLLWREGYFRQKSTQHVSQASINSQTLTETIPLLLAPRQEQDAIVVELNKFFSRLRSVDQAIQTARTRLHEYERFVVQAAAEGTLNLAQGHPSLATERSFDSAIELLTRLRNENGPNVRHKGGRTAETKTDLFDVEESPLDHQPGPALPPLPAGWVWAQVSDVGSVTLGRQRSPQHQNGLHMRPYLRVANVFEDRIDFSDVLEMNFTPEEFEIYRLQHGDILLNEGQSPELVGRPAMFRGELDGLCFQNTLIRFRVYPGVSPGFALLVFRSYLHNGRFRSIAKWTTNIAHLGAQRFSQLEFPLPPLAEQERTVAEAARRNDVAEALAGALSSILKQVDAARHLALTQAFTGKLVKPIANDFPAIEMLELIRAGRTQSITLRPQVDNGGTMVRAAAKRRRNRVPLMQALADAGRPLSPEELLSASGIGEDLIEEFFAELKAAHLAGRVRQSRDSQGQIGLSIAEVVR